MTKRWLLALFLISGCTLAAVAATAESRWPPGTLTGTVTDPDGRAVAGVPLWAITSPEQVNRGLPPSAVSGPDGAFSIPGLRPGKIELHACGPRHLHTSRTVWFLDEPVQLEVVPGVTLRGQVLGPEDTPKDTLAGVSIFAREVPAIYLEPGEHVDPDPWTPCPSPAWGTAGEDGRFEIGPLAPGRYDLEVSYFSTRATGLAQEEALPLHLTEAGEVEGIEIRVQNNGSRSGTLTDSTATPIYMGWVNVSTGDGESRSYLTEPDGSFRYFADPGKVTFRVETKGYRPLERIVEITADELPVDLAVECDESWKTVRGRVVGPRGDPVQGAWLYFLGGGPETHSAADGSFELQVLIEYSETLHVAKEGFAGGWLDVDLDAPRVVEGTIRLEPGAVVSGRVLGLTPGDRGLDARVKLHRPDGRSFETSLGADDTFRFENVPAGFWKLTLNARYRSVWKRIAVKPGQTEVMVDLSLPPRIPVSGRVLDNRGQPLAGAEVFASKEDVTLAAGGTRRDGSFELHVPRGTLQLTVSHPGLRGDPLEVPVRQRPVTGLTIRLKPAPSDDVAVTGRVLGLAPGQGAEIVGTMSQGSWDHYSQAWFEEDRFRLSLAPGSWKLQGFLYDAAGHFQTKMYWIVEVPAGRAEMELDLDLADAKPVPEEEP